MLCLPVPDCKQASFSYPFSATVSPLLCFSLMILPFKKAPKGNAHVLSGVPRRIEAGMHVGEKHVSLYSGVGSVGREVNVKESTLYIKQSVFRTSLAVQWIRICLQCCWTWVRSLVSEDFTCLGAAKPMHHNSWACVLQLLKPTCLEPVRPDARSHWNEKPAHHDEERPLLSVTRESPLAATKT